MANTQSSLFGEVEYKPNEIYTFEQGIPGFPDEKEFLLLQIEDSPFTVLHAVQNDVYFFLIDPFTLYKDYEFTISEFTQSMLEIETQEQVLCFVIAVLREPFQDSTVNLVAPVIINREKWKGAQIVLENTPYKVRHPLALAGKQTQRQEKEQWGQAAGN